MKRNKLHSGQALLLILLAMAVVLTVVLSVVSKSVTDVAITTYEVDSLRAFSAAEAGIEDALADATIGVGSSSDPDISVGSAFYNWNAESASPVGAGLYDLGSLSSGESATVWFVSHSADGGFICDEDNPCTNMENIYVCWGKNGETENSAIEISIYYDDSINNDYLSEDFSNVKVKRLVYDSNPDRIDENNFSQIDSNVTECTGYLYGKSENITSVIGSCVNSNCLIYAKVRLLYNSNPQSVAFGGASLPSQGLNINSTGSDGEVQRKIQVFQPYPQPPEIFDNVLFTEGSI